MLTARLRREGRVLIYDIRLAGRSAERGCGKIMVHFIVHGKHDLVGVLVTDAAAGESLTGWNMETGETLRLAVRADIPLGHKVALAAIPAGGPVIKYNVPIGRATAEIRPGEHVHVHNLKSARW